MAAGDLGLISGQGTRIPNATEELSLQAATRVYATVKDRTGLNEDP